MLRQIALAGILSVYSCVAWAAGSPVCVIVDTSGNCVSSAHPLPVTASGGVFTANVTQWASGTLGAMANYGTSPGLVLVPGVNAFVTNTVPVTGIFWQATQPISVVSLPLPANAAQETGGNLATLAGAISASVIQSNTKQVNGVMTSTGAGAVGTGSQRIAVGQDTTTIAGSSPGTAGSASASVVTVQGVASMTPILSNITQWASSALGAMANYGTSPGAVLVPGVNAFITNTIAVGNPLGVTPTDRTITSASGSSQQIMGANASRHSLIIENTGNANCGVNPTGGAAAIGGAGTLTLVPLGAYSPRIPTLSAVTIICTAAQPIYGEEN